MCPSLLLASLDSSLGNLATSFIGLDNAFNYAHSDSLTHVTDGETTKWWVIGESLDTHGLAGNHLDDGSVAGLDELGVVLDGLSGTAIDLLEELGELAGNVGSVAIQDWGVASTDLTGVVEDDDLGVEGIGTLGGVVLGVTGNVATTNLLDGDVLDVEADVVTGNTLDELFVVHFDGLDFSGDVGRGEGDDHAGLDDTGFDTTDGNRSNTRDLVDILERETERLVGRTRGRVDGVDGLEESLAGDLAAGLGLLLPALVPWAVGGVVDHVVAVEARDGHERNSLGVVTDLLDEVGRLLDDFVESILGPLGGVHFVDGNDELLDTQSVGEEGVLTGLAILGDTGLEFTGTGGNDENGAVGLGSTSDHVLDKVTVTRGVNDGDHVAGGLELPESDIDGDTTLTLGLQLVQNPGILEGALAQLSGFLLELLDGSLVNTTALVDQVASSGGFAGVDMADDDDVDMSLFFTHVDG